MQDAPTNQPTDVGGGTPPAPTPPATGDGQEEPIQPVQPVTPPPAVPTAEEGNQPPQQ